jgi:hypothetical protein
LVGSSCDIRPLGKRGRVGSVGCDAHAIGIKKNGEQLMRVAYQAAGVAQIWHKKKNCRTCHTVDFGQMWPENDAHDWSLEGLVTQQTLAKSGKK